MGRVDEWRRKRRQRGRIGRKRERGNQQPARRKGNQERRIQKKPTTPGAITDEDRSLSEEAHTVMGRLSHVIVEHLLVRANQGDMKSAQMLVELAKEEAEAKEVLERGPHRSQALAWAAEPPWQDEVDGEKAETWSGSREAEQRVETGKRMRWNVAERGHAFSLRCGR